MDKLFFSIIIPIYNRGLDVINTLDSIKNQNFENYEVILIDDGSTDNTFNICKEYCVNNSKFKLYHYENRGVSIARNRGIDKAIGKYILFLDADDTLEKNSLEKLHEYQKKYEADLIVFGIKYYYTLTEFTQICNKLEKNIIYDKDRINKYIIPSIINLDSSKSQSIEPYVFNKLYKRKIINRYHIYFNENRSFWEDKPFVAEYIYHINNMLIIEESLYHYINTVNSLSKKYEKNKIMIIVENAILYERLFKNNVYFDEKKLAQHYFKQINDELLDLVDYGKEKYKDIINVIDYIFCNKKIYDWYKNVIPDNNYQKKLVKYFFQKDSEKYFSLIKKQYYVIKMRTKLNKVRIKIFHRINGYLRNKIA